MKYYTAEERRLAIAQALLHPLATPQTVLFQSRHQSLPVVDLTMDLLPFNVRNHRLGAQIEAHPLRDLLLNTPDHPEAQAVLEQMLAQVEHFDDLVQNLDHDGQREAGLATPDGVLINANRRKAALKRLGRRTMRVAILPAAPQADYDDLELDLQVRKDFREPYSFANELLIVQELLNRRGLTEQQVARRLGFAASDHGPELREGVQAVRSCTRKLHLLRRLQKLSEGRLALCFFDGNKTTIDELDRDHQELLKRSSDPNRAERLLLMRLVGMLVGVDYRWLREVDDDFLERHLRPLLLRKPEWLPYLGLFEAAGPNAFEEAAELPGLDLLADDNPMPDVVVPLADAAVALDRLARARAAEEIELPGPDGKRVTWGRLTDELGAAIERAAKDAKDDRKAAARAEGPFRRLDQIEHLLGVLLDRALDHRDMTPVERTDYAARVRRVAELAGDLEATLTDETEEENPE